MFKVGSSITRQIEMHDPTIGQNFKRPLPYEFEYSVSEHVIEFDSKMNENI